MQPKNQQYIERYGDCDQQPSVALSKALIDEVNPRKADSVKKRTDREGDSCDDGRDLLHCQVGRDLDEEVTKHKGATDGKRHRGPILHAKTLGELKRKYLVVSTNWFNCNQN